MSLRVVPVLLLLLFPAGPSLQEIFDPYSDQWPPAGARTEQRLASFERALQDASPPAVLKALRGAERTLARLQKDIDGCYRTFLKASDKFFGWRRDYERDHLRKQGTMPAEYPVPPALQKTYLDCELVLKKALAFKRAEFLFLERVEDALVARWSADPAALAARAARDGASDRDRVHAVFCADLLGRMGAAAELDDAIDRERDPGVLAALVEARGRVRDDGALASLAAGLAHEAWPVRAGAIRGLAHQGTADAVAALVRYLAQAEGRLVDDTASALAALTGRTPSPEADAWRAWWSEARESWDAPEPAAGPRAVRSDDAPQLLGVPTRSLRVVLVLDGSEPEALEAMRTAAAHALDQLPEDASFGLVVYGHEADAFRKGMSENNGANRAAAGEWLARYEFEPGPQMGHANLFAGMEAAFAIAGGDRGAPEADTIVAQVWREPSSGWCLDPLLLASEVNHLNRPRGIRLHLVGPSPARHSQYLQRMAAPFGGVWLGSE